MITSATAHRVELKVQRHRAVKESGLTLKQMEVLSNYRQGLTLRQSRTWAFLVWGIGYELGEYVIWSTADQEYPAADDWEEIEDDDA